MGDVWICSGQSNMEMGITAVKDGEKEAAVANFPQIRLFLVPKRAAGEPLADVDAKWAVCTPEAIKADGWGGFSALAYFFGRELHNALQVPIGLVDSSWGGTRIEPWTPPVGFAAVPALEDIQQIVERNDAQYRQNVAKSIYRSIGLAVLFAGFFVIRRPTLMTAH